MAEQVITPDDVVRAGACASGVGAALRRIAKRATVAAAMPVAAVLKLVSSSEAEYVRRAAALDGYGYGYGYGDREGGGQAYA
jgi:hypothetical protein